MRRPIAVALVLAAVLAGCAPAKPGTPGRPTTAQYLDARRSAGIPDCPSGTPQQARTDGLPDVTLECLGGTSFVHLPDLAGTPTLVVAWAQWCDPCRHEAPLLARVLPDYDGKLTVLLVDANDPKTDRAIEFASDAGLTRWPVVVDPDWALNNGSKTQRVLPVSYLVAADGRIVERKLGAWSDDDELRSALRDKLGVNA